MEAPTPDGYVMIETIRPRLGENAVRHFNFRDITTWRKKEDGVTIIGLEDAEGRKVIHFFPWHNIAELEWRINSQAYRDAHREWQKHHDMNEPPLRPAGMPKLPPMTHIRFP
jgi:hypothetical protein